MNKLERCLYQVFRGERIKCSFIRKEGWGDCSSCKYNLEENKRCKGYTPIRIGVVDVKD